MEKISGSFAPEGSLDDLELLTPLPAIVAIGGFAAKTNGTFTVGKKDEALSMGGFGSYPVDDEGKRIEDWPYAD